MTIFTNFAKVFCSGEITMYKIYVLSSKESQLPYEVEGVKNDLSKEIKWKFIGEVDDYEIAKYMVEHDRCYAKKNDVDYWIDYEPYSDGWNDFCKIEYNDVVEYYDIYHKSTDYYFVRRF